MKNNFKHIIALILVLVMSFQMAAFVAADEAVAEEVVEEEVYIPQSIREFQILNALGIFSIYEEEDFTGNAELTRAEAAAVAARMTGLVDGSLAEGKEMPYTDVKAGDTYDYEIYHMSNLGIMSGYNGEFNPDGSITEEQFVKVVVEVLGYGPEAQSMGGYPHGYTITAGKYHMLDDVVFKGNVPLTQDVAVKIIYNCLDVEMPKVSSVDNGGYLTTVGGTIMSKYLNVSRAYGVLNRTSNTHISAGETAKKGMVQIGDNFYFVGSSNCDEYLGYNVEFFYKKTADDALGTILWVAPWQNEIIRVESYDIVNYANKEYKFYVGNAEQTKKITGADIIYNGSSVKSLGFNNFKPELGYVELIDNDIDGIIDVVSISSFDVYYVKANNGTEYVITTDDNKRIKDYDKAYWNVVDANDEELPAAKLKKNMVLLLRVSLDGKVVIGFQVNEQIEGTYEGKYTEGKVQHAIIGGKDYRVHSYCAEDYSKMKIGDYVGFYVYGDLLLIKCLPESSLTESVGYLIEIGSDTSAFEGKIMVRMLLQTGEVKIVDVNKKAKLDIKGKIYKDFDFDEFNNLLTYTLEHYAGEEGNGDAAGIPEVTVRQPVVYKLNDVGELVYLHTSATHNSDEAVGPASDVEGFNLATLIRGKWIRVTPGLRSIGDSRVLLDKDAFVIDVPEELDNYKGYKITKFVSMPQGWDTGADGNYTRPYRLYRTGSDILGANIMVGTKIRSSSGSGGSTFIVDKIAEGITDDGVECYILSGKTTSLSNVTIKTADKAVFEDHVSPTITIGDLVSCSKNAAGLADEIKMRYDCETAKVISNSGEYLGHGEFNVGGQVYKIQGDSMAFYQGVIPEGATYDKIKGSLAYLDIKGYKFAIVDTSLDRADSHIINASLGEVKTYVEDPENVSTFIATRSSMLPGIFIIYRK